MTKRALLLVIGMVLSLSLSSVSPAMSQGSSANSDLKIGYVDPQAILSKMPEMKAVQQKLRNFAERKQQELQEKQQNFQQQLEQFQQKSAVISDEAKKQEEQRLGELNAELQQFQTEIQQQIQQRQQKLMEPIYSKMEEAINAVASRQDLSYVLNTTTTNGDVIILYASDEAKQKYNITDAVMQELGI